MRVSSENNHSLLFITHINFWERSQGSGMRLYNMLCYLKAYFSITIVYISRRRSDDFAKLKKIGYHKLVVFLDELDESETNEEEIDTFLNTHAVLKDFYDVSIYRKMQTFVNKNIIGSVIVEYIHLSYFLPLFGSKKCFLDSHDIMNMRNELFKKNKQEHWIDISEEEEFSLFALYHKVLTIQKNEYTYLAKNNIASLLVPYSLSSIKNRHRYMMKNLAFVGAQTAANIEAITWFISEVWPLFACSGLQLKICGDVSQSIQGTKEALYEKNIILLGRVDDLDSFYLHDVDLIINPVHIGGGLKIKNAEALAYGLPLITTMEGANGLEDGSNNAFLLANSIEEWQDVIITLMLSNTLREKLSINAYNFAKKHFDEKVCYDELIHVLLRKSNDSPNGDIIDTKTDIPRQYNQNIVSLIPREINIEEMIATLHESALEVKKQMHQYQKCILAHELLSYREALDALATTSIVKHPIAKIIKYKALIRHYKKFKHFTYDTSQIKEDQALVHNYRERLEELCAISLKHYPKKKIKVYKQLIEWYSNLNNQISDH